MHDAVELGLRRIERQAPETREALYARIRKLAQRFLTIVHFEGDVSKDADFQRTFNWFYQVRRDSAWRGEFYRFFQERREAEDPQEFASIFNKLREFSNKWEYSFTTKLLHTLDNSRPIIDAKVMRFLGIPLKGERSTERCNEHYQTFCKTIVCLLARPQIKQILAELDREVPLLKNISSVKKLDLIMWQWEFENIGYTSAMAKRANVDIRRKKTRNKKTGKRQEAKRVMLASRGFTWRVGHKG